MTFENPETICERILAGESLHDICRDDPDMESLATVSRWLGEEASTAFRERHGLPCEILADDMGHEMLEAADDASVSLPRARRRVEAIMELMAAFAPKKYGDMLDAENGGCGGRYGIPREMPNGLTAEGLPFAAPIIASLCRYRSLPGIARIIAAYVEAHGMERLAGAIRPYMQAFVVNDLSADCNAV